MLSLIPVICVLLCCICMAVLVCLAKSDNLVLLFSTIGVGSLICLGIVTANYSANFNAFSILVIISIIPLFITLFKLNIYKAKNDENQEEKDSRENKNKTLTSILKGTGFLLSSICLSFAVLYIGLETFTIALLGLFIGLALTFWDAILMKTYEIKKKYGFLTEFGANFIQFFSVGLFLSCALSSVMYAFVLKSALFAIGAIILAAHIILNRYVKIKYVNIVYYLGVIFLISSFLV